MTETLPFDDALAMFLRFIQDQGFSSEIIWVFREDVTNCRRQYWVRFPVPEENADLARAYYEVGRKKGLGVSLRVACRVHGRPACNVWVPKDQMDAEYAMQGPLKLSTPVDQVDAISIRSLLLWYCRCLLNRWRKCVTFADLIPLRREARRAAKK